MRRLLRIGDLVLPPDTVTSTIIAFGGKGSGKTVFGAVLAEELAAANLRWAWLDPLGVGYGLRYAENGSGKGVECLILGGAHGDIPISPDAGAAVADIVVEELGNVLVDFSRKPSGEMWGIGEKIRFATAYARRLFQRQGDLVGGKRRAPLMQFLDEGARYVPQTVPAGNPGLAESVSAWQQLVEEGRNVGIGVCVLTQRSARISKDVAELADAMFAFRTVGPRSLGAVLDWLGDHVERHRLKELSAEVRKLPRGSALVVSPGWLEVEKVIAIRMRRTFDSSATPKPGERPRHVRGDGAKPNLERIRAKMAEVIERAKQDDPKALRAEVAVLKKELEKAQAQLLEAPLERTRAKWAAPKLEPWEVVVDGRNLKEILETAEALENSASHFGAHLHELRTAVTVAHSAVRRARQTGPAALAKRLERANPAPTPANVTRPRKPENPQPAALVRASQRSFRRAEEKEISDTPTAPERRLLTAMAQYGRAIEVKRLAIRSGYTVNGHFHNTLGGLRTKAWAEGRGNVSITEAGRVALGDYEQLPTGQALFDYWKAKLPKPEGALLDVLRSGEEITTADLAQRAGYTVNGHFHNTLGHLRSLELVFGRGSVRISEELL